MILRERRAVHKLTGYWYATGARSAKHIRAGCSDRRNMLPSKFAPLFLGVEKQHIGMVVPQWLFFMAMWKKKLRTVVFFVLSFPFFRRNFFFKF